MMNIAIAVVVYTFIAVILYIGVALGRWFRKWEKSRIVANIGTIEVAEGAVFALLGLLIAFTFSGAYDRFEQRKERIIDEVSAMETAYLRLDLIPDSQNKRNLQQALLNYVNARIDTYQHPPTFLDFTTTSAPTLIARAKLWKMTMDTVTPLNIQATTMLVIPALNNLFEIANTRHLHTRIHPPIAIFLLLIGLAFIAAFLVGYNMKRTHFYSAIYTGSFVIITSLTIYITIDLEFPRVGLIRINQFDNLLIEARDQMIKPNF